MSEFLMFVNKIFIKQIRTNVDAFVNNMLIKHSKVDKYIINLEETFQVF